MSQQTDADFFGALFPSSEPTIPLSRYMTALIRASKPKTDGIWFYRNNGEKVRFSEPVQLPAHRYDLAFPPIPGPGLYAVLVPDNAASPRPFRVLYFGESEELDERVSSSHERYDDWCNAAKGAANVYVAYHWMTFSSKADRTAMYSHSGRQHRHRLRC